MIVLSIKKTFATLVLDTTSPWRKSVLNGWPASAHWTEVQQT